MMTMLEPNETNFDSEENNNYVSTTVQTTVVTNTVENSPVSLKPDLQNTTTISYAGNIDIKNDSVHFSNIMSDTLEYLKKMLGLTPPCLNGGMKTLRGECICPKFYRGDLCDELVCVNNGTLEQISKLDPVQYACRCPYPEYIHGQHCEHVKCLNGGRPMDNGHCKCLEYWYTGQFCQEYAASWGFVLGLPLLCIAIVIVCCIVCRLDLFPRKPAHSRRRRRASLNELWDESLSHRRRGLEMRRGNNRTGNELYLRMQENLLSDNSGDPLVLRPYNYFLSSYIIQLDTIPALNPNISTNANFSKPFDAPPSYDEAVATFSASQQPANRTMTGGAILPPEYTSCQRLPVLRFQSPNIPRNT